jgi:hypothetical protein
LKNSNIFDFLKKSKIKFTKFTFLIRVGKNCYNHQLILSSNFESIHCFDFYRFVQIGVHFKMTTMIYLDRECFENNNNKNTKLFIDLLIACIPFMYITYILNVCFFYVRFYFKICILLLLMKREIVKEHN